MCSHFYLLKRDRVNAKWYWIINLFTLFCVLATGDQLSGCACTREVLQLRTELALLKATLSGQKQYTLVSPFYTYLTRRPISTVVNFSFGYMIQGLPFSQLAADQFDWHKPMFSVVLCGLPLPASANSWICGAATKHTTTLITLISHSKR